METYLRMTSLPRHQKELIYI